MTVCMPLTFRLISFFAPLILLNISILAADLQPGDMVIPKQDIELKLSGKVVGTAKSGEFLQVKEVRGAWVNVGKKKPSWARLDQLIVGGNALTFLEEKIAAEPKNPAGYYARARYYLAQGELDNAEQDLARLADIEPTNADVSFQRGIIALKNNNIPRALEQFTLAIANKGDEPDYYRHRARLLRTQLDIPGTIADLEKLVDLNAADAQDYNSLAWWYATSSNASQRNGKRAVKYALQACELSGYTNFAILDTLAAAYAESNDYPNAIRWQEDAIKHCDNSLEKKGCEDRLKQYKLNQPFREDPH